MLLLVTIVLQGVVIYVPMSILHGMGHRVLYSIKTYGITWEVIFLIILLGPPSAALWSAYRAARSKASALGAAGLYSLLLIPVALLVGLSVVIAAISGLR